MQNKYGCIYQDTNGSYFVKTQVYTRDGYLRYITKRGFSNKSEALAYKVAEMERVQNSYAFEQNNQNIMLYEYFDLYLQEYSISNEQSTAYSMRGIIKNYFKPNIPNVQIGKLKPSFLTHFRASVSKANNLNSDSKNKRITALKVIIQSAIDKSYLDEKLGRLCLNELKPVASDGHIVKNDYWEIEEYKAFINSFKDCDRFKIFFICLFNFGCRISEITALKWKHLHENSITITDQVVTKLGTGTWAIKHSTKTKEARITDISENLTKLLLEFKVSNNYTDDDFMFFGNSPISEHAICYQRIKHCKMANVKCIRNHDFRHSYITTLLDKGVDVKAVASQVGHADVSTTLNIYNHVSRSRQDKLKETLDSLPI